MSNPGSPQSLLFARFANEVSIGGTPVIGGNFRYTASEIKDILHDLVDDAANNGQDLDAVQKDYIDNIIDQLPSDLVAYRRTDSSGLTQVAFYNVENGKIRSQIAFGGNYVGPVRYSNGSSFELLTFGNTTRVNYFSNFTNLQTIEDVPFSTMAYGADAESFNYRLQNEYNSYAYGNHAKIGVVIPRLANAVVYEASRYTVNPPSLALDLIFGRVKSIKEIREVAKVYFGFPDIGDSSSRAKFYADVNNLEDYLLPVVGTEGLTRYNMQGDLDFLQLSTRFGASPNDFDVLNVGTDGRIVGYGDLTVLDIDYFASYIRSFHAMAIESLAIPPGTPSKLISENVGNQTHVAISPGEYLEQPEIIVTATRLDQETGERVVKSTKTKFDSSGNAIQSTTEVEFEATGSLKSVRSGGQVYGPGSPNWGTITELVKLYKPAPSHLFNSIADEYNLGSLDTSSFTHYDLEVSPQGALSLEIGQSSDGLLTLSRAYDLDELGNLISETTSVPQIFGDIPLVNSAGRVVPGTDVGDFFDVSDGAQVRTYHDGPLEGITRIKLTGSSQPLGFIQFDQAGAILGSMLGKSLAGDNRIAQVAASAFLKTVGQTLGGVVNGLVGDAGSSEIKKVLDSFDEELLRNIQLKGVGALSTYLVSELVESIGVDGFVGDVVNTGISELLRSQVANILGIQTNASVVNVAGAIGSLIGTKLASEVISFGSVGGQIGSAVGGAVGAILVAVLVAIPALTGVGAALIANVALNAVLPGIGAFVGFILGGLIGSVFGGTPRSGADAQWDSASGRFVVANVYSKKGGSKDAARSVAGAVSDTFNAVLGAAGGVLIDPAAVQSGNYGMRKSDFVYRPTSTRDKDAITQRFSGENAAARLIGYGVFQGLSDPDFRIAGGDVYVKRALYNTFELGGLDSLNFDSNVVLGNIASARSYEHYLANAGIINTLVAAEPDSVFASEVFITLARANELGLTRRHKSDWFGGFTYLMNSGDVNAANVAFGFEYDGASDRISRAIGVGSYVLGDTIDVGGQTVIEGTVASDLIDLRSAQLTDQSGLTVNGHFNNDIAASGADFTAKSVSVVFAAADLRKSVPVIVTADAIAEVTESFLGRLTNASGVTVMGGEAVATVINGTATLPSLTVGDSFAAEADGYAVFRLSLSKATSTAITVSLNLKKGTADNSGGDFGSAGAANLQVSVDGVNWTNATSATFAPLATELFVRTPVIADNIPNPEYTPENGKPQFLNVEGNERFTLDAMVTAGAAALSNGSETVSGVGTIVDGASADPLVWIDSVTIDEASGQAVFVISRSRSGAVGSVDFATADRRQLGIEIAATVDGGDGNDTIYASNLGDNIFGGAGNDMLYGGRLDDWLLGGDGNDTLDAGTLDQNALGGDGNYLNGGAGDDILRGREGSDWLEGGDGTDTLTGGLGDDILAGGGGAGDNAKGGMGDDQYLVRLGDGEDIAEDEATGAPADTGAGDAITQRYAAIAAGTVKRNWAGSSTAVQQNKIAGGEDSVVFAAGITMGDIQLVRSGGAGNDLIIRIMQTNPDTGVESYSGTSLTVKDWFTNPFKRIEWLKFTDGNEIRIGDITSFIIGGEGNDVLIGTQGNDFVYGGAGNDRLFLLGGDDIGNGGSGDDMVSGDTGRDLVIGGLGADELIGGAGSDAISGDDGADDIYGGADRDILSGGRGDGDQVVGGGGDDTFRYSRGDGRDTIFDDFSNNWSTVWTAAGQWNTAGGFSYNSTTGEVTGPGGVLIRKNFGTTENPEFRWVGRFDYDSVSQTFRYFNPPVGATTTVSNNGVDTLEFAPGINLQDVILRRVGNDLVMAIANDDLETFDSSQVSDSVTIKDWYVAPGQIEKVAFYETGILDITSGVTNLIAGTDLADGTTVTPFAGTTLADWITAGAGDDVVAGGSGNDIISGNTGSDTLRGEAGDDVLFGGAGNDSLDGGAGSDVLVGGNGIDTASYASASASVRVRLSLASNNTGDAAGDEFISIENIAGGSGLDNIGGDAYDNELTGNGGADFLFGGAGNDTYVWNTSDGADVAKDGAFTVEEVVDAAGNLMAGYTVSWIQTGSFKANTFWRLTVTGPGSETVYDKTFTYATANPPQPAPMAWDPAGWLAGFARTNGYQVTRDKFNTAISGGDEDVLELGAGISLSDLTFIRSTADAPDPAGLDLIVRYNDSSGTQIAIRNHFTVYGRIETLQFQDGLAVSLASILNATSGTALNGTTGDDLINGRTGILNDILYGLAGNDVLNGQAGADQLYGGDGDDVLEGGAGADLIDGGANAAGGAGDTARYVRSSAVTIDLRNTTTGQSNGDATGDILVGIENVVGSLTGNDTITGDDNANRIDGLDGANTLYGKGGDDVLVSGAGADLLYGELGDDNISAGDGNDQAWGGDGADIIVGGAGDDQLRGEAGNDRLFGGDGNDSVLDGGAGNDEIYGEAGNDSLTGGDGNDTLGGGAGNDSLQGGLGDDIYFIQSNDGADTITDTSGTNVISFDSGITHDRVWLTQAGSDLKIAVIGENTVITVAGFFAGTNPGRIKTIQTTTHAIFLDHPDTLNLIAAMTAASATPPATVPQSIADIQGRYWHQGGKAAPIAPASPRAVSTNEDTPVAIDGSYGAVDHDSNINGYQLKSDAGPSKGVISGFNATTGALTYTPNANATGTDRFVVIVTDADGNATELPVDVTIAAINDAPGGIVVKPGFTLAVAENTAAVPLAAGTIVAEFAATDVEGDGFVFSLVNDAGQRFTVSDDGKLSVANPASFDFETASTHTIRVRVTDTHGASSEMDFAVAVQNANDANSFAGPYSLNIDENVSIGTAIGSVAASDIDGAGTVLAEQRYYFWDGSTASGTSTDGRYAINALTGQITTNAALSFEVAQPSKIYQVIARDNAGNAGYNQAQTNVTIGINDLNEAPISLNWAPAIGAVAERDRVGAGTTRPAITLGTLSVTDPDNAGLPNATYTYSVTDTRFEIVGSTLRLRQDQWLDYEAATSVVVAVTGIDQTGNPFSINQNITIAVSDQDDVLEGTAGNDTLAGQSGRDLIYGFGGADTIQGNAGHDLLDGGDGDDLLQGGAGIDRIIGGLGNDRLEGGDGDDNSLAYTGVADGGLWGGAGNDTIIGGAGADLTYGEDGDDKFLIEEDGGSVVDRHDGGNGKDVISYEQFALGGVNVNLGNSANIGGEPSARLLYGDIITNVEDVTGTNFADTITGDGGANTLTGLDGNDTLTGGAGDDVLDGGAGADMLNGDDGADTLSGGAGNDIIHGGAGNDMLLGGDGDDQLYAEAGDDMLDGGAGNDILNGGIENDTYIVNRMSGADTIYNYDPSGDDIDVIGFQDAMGAINDQDLWFERVGNDLKISVIGTTSSVQVNNWYIVADATSRANHKIDFIIAGNRFSRTINIEGLATLMATKTKPTTLAERDTLMADTSYRSQWANYWGVNAAPDLAAIANKATNEDTTLAFAVTATDDITPNAQVQLSAQVISGTSITNSGISFGAADANGVRTMTINPVANASGTARIRVTATDAGGVTSFREFDVVVTGVADTPTVTQFAGGAGTAAQAGGIPLTVNVSFPDTDGSEVQEIWITGVPSGVTLSAGTYDTPSATWKLTAAQLANLKVNAPAGWSQDLSLSATARATENGQTAVSAVANTTVVINAPPTGASFTGSVNENASNATVIGTVTGIDPDAGDTLTFTLTNNASGRFSISTAGVLSVGNGSLLNYEAATSHSITVRVTDSFGKYVDQVLSVGVNDVNEANNITSSYNFSVNENVAVGTAVNSVAATDIDSSAGPFGQQRYYFWSGGVASATSSDGRYAINATSGQITVNGALDFEASQPSKSYTVIARDNAGNAGYNQVSSNVTIGINNVNEQNSIQSSYSFTIAENSSISTSVGTVAATDIDGSSTTQGTQRYYFWDGSTTNTTSSDGRYVINSSTGQIRSNAALNFEAANPVTSYTVIARDNTGLTGYNQVSTTVSISITNVNEANSIPSSYSFTIAENSTLGTAVGSVAATDIDSNTGPFGQQRYYFSNGGVASATSNDGRYAIDSLTGQITANAALNYEPSTGASKTYQVIARDNAGNSGYIQATSSVTIGITDVNEPHSLANKTAQINEVSGLPPLTTLYDLAQQMLTDPENRNMRWQFANGTGTSGIWTLSSDGKLSLTNGSVDYEEVTKVYVNGVWNGTRDPNLAYQALSVQAIDDRSDADPAQRVKSATLTAQIMDVNEAPTITSTAPGYLAVDQDKNGNVIQISATEFWVTANRDAGPVIQIYAADPEGQTNLTYSLVNVQSPIESRGNAGGDSEIEATAYPYLTGISSNGVISFTTPGEEYGEWEGGLNPPGDRHRASVTINFTVRVADSGGQYYDQLMKVVFVKRDTAAPPIGLDLDGDGLELVPYASSTIEFDMDGDGVRDETGWVAGDDGFLALDRNGNGTIDDITEISFIGDLEGALTDLEGLRVYDSDNDGMLDTDDAEYHRFLVWRDVNQDGVSQADELKTLADWNIDSINLTLSLTGQVPGQGENVVFATTEYQKTDGSLGVVGDLSLAYTPSNIDNIGAPVILDYDGDGASLLTLSNSNVRFDMDADGSLNRTGWIEQGDAFLALDRNGNGRIDDIREISFIGDTQGAKTDLEGLASFDTNHDGLLTADDARFVEFRLWFDQNVNGLTDAGELLSLAQAGITALNLTGTPVDPASGVARPNIIYNQSLFYRDNGTTGTALDAGIAFERIAADGTTQTAYAGWDGTPPLDSATNSDVAVSALPAVTFGGRDFDRKAKKYLIEARDGELFISPRKAGGLVDSRSGVIGGATILSFAKSDVGLLAPVVLDLDGDGLALRSQKKSGARFDMDGDGLADDTGWVGKGDGLLVIDRNNDGLITSASEISFLTEKSGATSDLDALSALDATRDGKLDGRDARFGELKVWVDANDNGVTDQDELKSLAEHGITEISLAARANNQKAKPGENIVAATTSFKRTDGSVGTVGDVVLAFDPSSTRTAGGSAFAARQSQIDAMREALSDGFKTAGKVTREADTQGMSDDDAQRISQMVQAMASFGVASREAETMLQRADRTHDYTFFAAS